MNISLNTTVMVYMQCQSTYQLNYLLESPQQDIDPNETHHDQQTHIVIGITTAITAAILSAICITLGIAIMKVAQHRQRLKSRYIICIPWYYAKAYTNLETEIFTGRKCWPILLPALIGATLSMNFLSCVSNCM